VKKPYDEKVGSIEKLYGDQKRYYPVTNGKVDEWGAVVQRQAENF